PDDDPEVVVAQLHSGVNSERVSVRTQTMSGETKLLVRINGAEALRLSESFEPGDDVEIEFRVRNGGAVDVYVGGWTAPSVSGQLVSTGAAGWHWRVGAWAQFNEEAVDDAEYVAVEHRDLRVTHSVGRVDVGPDALVVTGAEFTRKAQELGLTSVTARRWTIVSRPQPPEDPGTEPDPSDPPDTSTAAARFGWGTPLSVSDEFNYTGAPDSSKWKLPGSDWAGHNGNGRRRPERP